MSSHTPPQATPQASGSYIVLDIEASGLHPTSFPIEIAWAGPNIPAKSFLIKPDADWAIADWAIADWDEAAEDMYNISLTQIQRDGVAPKIIVTALLFDAENKAIISDGVSFDQNWLRMLFEVADQKHTLHLQDFTMWLGRHARTMNINPAHVIKTMQKFEENHPPIHRAADDVQRLLDLIDQCLPQGADRC